MKGIKKINTEVVVIGAGILGLAIARELSSTHDVLLLEKRSKFGEETSSRNSEVIHSGIHYPRESKKTQWCIRGRELLYSFCQKFEVPFKKAGKYVVATSETEQAYLRQLKQHADSLSVPCKFVTKKEVKQSEPLVECSEALFFSESGIVDSHSLMAKLERLAVAQGALFAFNRRVKNAYPNGDKWEVVCENPSGDEEVISCEVVVNSSGLGAAELANQILDTRIYEHRFCRGRYFNLGSKFRDTFQSLVYPCPSADGLGIHVTCDMAGMVRLGPDVDWCEKVSYLEVEKLYDCDWKEIKPVFWRAVQRYCPSIKLEDLSEGMVGVRPKLFIEGKPYRDFLSVNQNGSIHLLGIESPGLTASLAIAEAVRHLMIRP